MSPSEDNKCVKNVQEIKVEHSIAKKAVQEEVTEILHSELLLTF